MIGKIVILQNSNIISVIFTKGGVILITMVTGKKRITSSADEAPKDSALSNQ